MVGRPGKAAVIAAAALLGLVSAACSGSNRHLDADASRKAARGGTLTYYIRATTKVEHTDPQRTYAGRDLTNWGRTVYRSLVTFPVSGDAGIATTHVPDLATDTGQSSDNARTWRFTVKDGVTWEDGKPVTCEDLKYGASRVFATDVITGGPSYLLRYLDIPEDPQTGLPAYEGPYTRKGQDLFDKAVTCSGNTIEYHFKKPWADFPLAVAGLHMMDPYRADKDHGADSNFQIFSNGPYRLEGSWDEDKGGTLVRNENYDPGTDSTDVRKALPDRIVFDLRNSGEELADRIIADRGADKTAVTDFLFAPESYGRIAASVTGRAVSVQSPYTEFLVPNFRRLTNPYVRQALAASTDVVGWIAAGGGDRAYEVATDIVNPAVKGYQAGLFPGGSGDPKKSRRLLEQADVEMPYPIVFTYPRGGNMDAQASVLEKAWEAGGFRVSLDGVDDPDAYHTSVRDPAQKADVSWAAWGADWPSAVTVTPSLFDSRPNLTPQSNGNDQGAYRSEEFEALVDEAQQAADLDTQTLLLQQADKVLADDVAYIPLDIPVLYLLRGSGVTGYINTAASNAYPDLGAIGVR